MLDFRCDYAEGCDPLILSRLSDTNLLQTPGYGEDDICAAARDKIKAACSAPDAEVFFLVGGTQTNKTVIAHCLRTHEGVLCAEQGHIACHETGAIEATGHKVLPLPSHDGTLTAQQVDDALREHNESPIRQHMVKPGMVYLSHPTENGALYTRAQLQAISDVCRRWGVPLYIDGARLGYALAAPQNDIDLRDLARLCDLFYIGGTKCAALFGEALVVPNPVWAHELPYTIKQNGGLLAKGRLLGLQFDVLFTDDRYVENCRHALTLARRIADGCRALGLRLFVDSPTNQQFVMLTAAQQEALAAHCHFEEWTPLQDDGYGAVRFCVSWATRDEHVDALLACLRALV